MKKLLILFVVLFAVACSKKEAAPAADTADTQDTVELAGDATPIAEDATPAAADATPVDAAEPATSDAK